MRTINFLWQCLSLALLLISLGICLVLIDAQDLAEEACERMSTEAREREATTPMENCVKHTRMWMYIAWGTFVLVFVPI